MSMPESMSVEDAERMDQLLRALGALASSAGRLRAAIGEFVDEVGQFLECYYGRDKQSAETMPRPRCEAGARGRKR